MKKIVFILFIVSLIIIFNREKPYIIPSNSIRFRIVANSNSLQDQKNKIELKKVLEKELHTMLEESKSASDSRHILKNNIDNIKKIVSSKISNYDINYGINYFPEKEYRNVIYPEGYYESLVVTIGEGIGNNWWCVLYPPLCFVDENLDDYNYDLFIKNIFSKTTSKSS